MPSEAQRILIVSCSRRKTQEPGSKAAVDRYDGPTFRLLRRFLQSQPANQLAIYILSAEFGLIPSAQPIPSYDRQMTRVRSQELNPICLAKLNQILETNLYQEICICAGQTYLQALAGMDRVIPPEVNVRIIKGGLGKQLAELHDWLYGEPPKLPSKLPANHRGYPRLRGVEVVLTAEQVLDLAQQRIAESTKKATRYHSWYVFVDSQQVAPKWLVSQITGLPVSAFTSGEARRLLTQLGVEVKRVNDK